MSLDDIQVRNRQKFKLGIFDCSSRKKTFWVPRHDESPANSFSAGCSTLFLFRASRGVTNRWRTRKGRNQRLGCASVRLTARECRSAHSPKARSLQFHLIVLLRLSFMQIAWQVTSKFKLIWFEFVDNFSSPTPSVASPLTSPSTDAIPDDRFGDWSYRFPSIPSNQRHLWTWIVYNS